ncbi:MAG: DUF4249 domain-containing protein [bacterium]|nr:DUF4249 domain-containing protein [bacterium]
MKSILNRLFPFIALGLIACEELEVPEFNQYVVEAFITADENIYDIKIKETTSIIQEEIIDIPFPDATVTISANQESIELVYDDITGKYIDPSNSYEIEVGQEYEINIQLEDINATSSTVVPEKPTGLKLTDSVLIVPELLPTVFLRDQITELFDEEVITLSWTSVPDRHYFVVIESQVDSIDYILPQEIPEESLELLSSFKFISEPTQDTTFNIIAVALETYGQHVAKVYSVNQEYVDLFNSATQDSRDLNEPPSNVENALGIFTAFAVDSIEFTVRKE